MIQANLLKDEVLRVVDAIRNVFEVEGDLEEADVEAIHTQFVECIQTVNQRLRKCDELLRKGLRGEALQECEIKPKLLDLVIELDIEESEAWSDYVRQFGIPPQPALLDDIAGSLNDAYTQSQSLEDVLRLHRLHALARSPLKTRLSVLRTIAEKDAENPIWQEDLRQYETARFSELDSEFKQLSQERDISGLFDLGTELSHKGWLVKPPNRCCLRCKRPT